MGVIDSFTGEYDFLSNFYPCDLEVFGLVFTNAEAAYQSQKCKYEGDKNFFVGLPAGKAKRFGKRVILREDWEDVKYGVMLEVLWAKFTQNGDLVLRLLATGDRELVEGNTWGDTEWGVFMGEGKNMLGKLLMGVRAKLVEWE